MSSPLIVNPQASPSLYSKSIALSGGAVTAVDIEAAVTGGVRSVVIQGDDLDAVRVAVSTSGTTPADPAIPTTASVVANEYLFIPSHGITLMVAATAVGAPRITDLKFRAEVASAVVLTLQCFG